MTQHNRTPGQRPARATEQAVIYWRRFRLWLTARRTASPRLWALGLALSFVSGALLVAMIAATSDDHGPLPLVPMSAIDQSPDVTISLSPGLITALLNQSIAQGQSPVPLEDVRVETASGRLVVRGNLNVLRRRIGGRIEMEPYVAGGHLRMRMREAKLGPISAPAGLERLAEAPINDRITAAVGGLPAEITSVRTDEHGVTVTARVLVGRLVSTDLDLP